MNPIDRSRDDHADDERLSAELGGLRPVQPGGDLRARIAAELARVEPCDAAGPPPRRRLRAIGERLAWAAGGAVAASLALLLAGAEFTGREPTAVARVTAVEPTPVAAATPSRVSEDAVSWSDEGIRFVDEFTPARVLRRTVIERHLAGDGAAEVRVPREDVILLPVALR
jgi:hypothetical protein